MDNLPTNPHDWAVWLLERLQGLQNVGPNWEGRLPDEWSFNAITQTIPPALEAMVDGATRRIEFKPKNGSVYQTFQELVDGPRKRNVPSLFTVRELGYTHGRAQEVPPVVQYYLDAVQLWKCMASFADHERDGGSHLLFIKAFDSKLWLTADYVAADLQLLPRLKDFAKQYFEDDHHKDQKRNIVRAALLEVFKNKPSVRFAELLFSFIDFADRVRSSYTLYTQGFSFEKLRSEVDKQNREDTLRLNKTFSDIQNQLLALPAALLAAGAAIKGNSWSTNLPVLLGVGIFMWVIRQLVANQQSSIDAIAGEIELRRKKLADQPSEISEGVLGLFQELEARVRRQKRVLAQIRGAVHVVFIVVAMLVVLAQWPDLPHLIAVRATELLAWLLHR
ncbi:hypothetical protein VLK31_29820 [Variovorax sp. H27-G14]|uniref:hypothetical protein n=1 Tax=Variovorax sp. H27-G14 TaxID=3111914 RepID=UPI0038FC539C